MTNFDVDPTFDPEDGQYHLKCDWRTVPGAGIVLVEAVAHVMCCDPLDLEPLQNAVDVDGIESILTGRHVAPVTIEFEYANARIRVGRDGHVVIDPK
ncbi:HalOD1 output domain-containing protein [Halorubellus sp. PRR65]|uniref:HalOD1 output domain-containing protein n=1 Tax=Halorubellus sp. PRR65 TaxID=3098148 RepID=UPI002B25F242|nr:HalOD1 output domain-containing protein [Halorubellus sp. PRR65]